MTAGKEIDGGTPGGLPRTQGGDDGTKSNDKKAVDKSTAPLTEDEQKAAGDPSTPAQYSY